MDTSEQIRLLNQEQNRVYSLDNRTSYTRGGTSSSAPSKKRQSFLIAIGFVLGLYFAPHFYQIYGEDGSLNLESVIIGIYSIVTGDNIKEEKEEAKPSTPPADDEKKQAETPAVSDEKLQTLAAARALVEQDPNNADAWISLGHAFYDVKQFQDGIDAYSRALEIDPNNADVLTDRGTLYRELGKPHLALANYESASKIDPKHENSLFNAGVVLYIDLKRTDEARAKFEQLLKINPDAKSSDGNSVRDLINSM